MPKYRIVLEARGPLLLGERLPEGNVLTSRAFVAGSVLRGAVAKAILTPLGLWRHSGRPLPSQPLPSPFESVFLGSNPARFGFLYPARHSAGKLGGGYTFPLPLTAQSCKAKKGFVADGRHGVVDSLMPRLRWAAGGRGSLKRDCSFPGCNERLDRLRGFAIRLPEVTHQVKVAPRTFVRVGLNRRTETAESSILYTLEALVPGPETDEAGEIDPPATEKPLSFAGYWTMSTAQWQELTALLAASLPQTEGGYDLRIGSARARGMGAVRLLLPDVPEPDDPLAEWVEAFQPRDRGGQRLDADHLYVSLTLRAPTLLYNEWGQPTPAIEAPLIGAYLPTPPGLTFCPEASIIEQETWSGWSAAWGLPKPSTPALAAGSILSFRVPATEQAALLTFLQQVDEVGLGERRAEGWGEVSLCDPFHRKFDSKEMNNEC